MWCSSVKIIMQNKTCKYLKLVFITELIFSENSESNSKSHEPSDVGTSVVLTARLATKICQFFITLFTNTEGAGLTTYSSQTLRCLGFTLEEQSCCQTLCHWFQHDNIESYRNGFPGLLLIEPDWPAQSRDVMPIHHKLEKSAMSQTWSANNGAGRLMLPAAGLTSAAKTETRKLQHIFASGFRIT